MSAGKMHVDEVDTNVSLVSDYSPRSFHNGQTFPSSRSSSAGTDNALYRLGDDMVVRLPRIRSAVGDVEREHQWLPRLAPFLPLAIPLPLAKGKPGEGYPWHWSVYRWLRERYHRVHCRFTPSGDRPGTVCRCPVADRSRRRAARWPRRAARAARCFTREAIGSAWHDRRRRSNCGVGSSPWGTGVAWSTCLGPRRLCYLETCWSSRAG
jgi:aminoglycoside phosphotransferase (APT) family kinase protein